MNTIRQPEIPAITKIIADGYGKDMLRTVIESLRCMATSMRANYNITDREEADILNLLMLEEAILKDCYGIDVHEIV